MPKTRSHATGADGAASLISGDEEYEETSQPSQAQGNITMSQHDLTTLLTSLQQSQQTFYKEILREVRASTPSSPDVTSQSFFASIPPANFAKCTSKFSGDSNESLEGFIDAIEVYKLCLNITDDNALRGLALLLSNSAAVWWQGVKATTHTWSEALRRLRGAFGERRPPFRIYQELFALSQGDESTDLFISKVRALLSKIPQGDLSEKVEIDLVFGLLDRRIRKRIDRDNIKTFEELLTKARSIEDSQRVSRNEQAVLQPSQGGADCTPRVNAAVATTVDTSKKHRVSSDTARATESTSAIVPVVSPSSESEPKKLFCVYCKSYGHLRDGCHKLRYNGQKSEPLKCYGCGALNVSRSKCEKCNSSSTRGQAFCSLETAFGKLDYNNSVPQKTFSDITCNNCYFETCMCKESYVKSYHHTMQSNSVGYKPLTLSKGTGGFQQSRWYHNIPEPDGGDCETIHLPNRVKNVLPLFPLESDVQHDGLGQLVKLSSYTSSPQTLAVSENSNGTKTSFGLNNVSYCQTFSQVTQNINSHQRPILKICILNENGTALVDSAAKSCVAGHTLHALLSAKQHPMHPSTQNVKLADGVSRVMEVLTTEVMVTLKHKSKLVKFLIFPDANNNETLLGIDFLQNFNISVNFGESVWHFAENTKEKFKLDYEGLSFTHEGVSSTSIVDMLRPDEATSLSNVQLEKLSKLLADNDDIFQPGGEPTTCAEHKIDTGDHPPIAVPPYRLTPAKREIMQAELDKMLADDIVEECESAWAAPALLVPKKNGQVRFCVDYRRLNAVTKSDVYPMPLIDDLIQSTKKGCIMSTLDMRSGFWQIGVHEADRDKTAFITPCGAYRFKRMPFGLKNAPSSFQRLIDRLRSGVSLKDVTILAYQDDLLVISESFERHIADLRAVFERLRLFNLKANRDKCVFARQQVKYLGHVISQDGISPDDDKVRAIVEMKAPTTLRHLRTFLQTCSWFRKFIPNFSSVAEPLTRLLKKNQQWVWNTDQANAFMELKKRLTSTPILSQADFTKPFVLRTDASNYALGAVLLQGEDKNERPIEYASRLLIPAERNYSTTEREALAVVWAVERFRCYIEGQQIVIASDHQPLKWLLTLKSPSGRLVRWALKLQSFNIQFQYTPGKANVVADTLSRPPCNDEEKEQCGLCAVVVDLPSRSASELRRSQLDDPELEKIIVVFESHSDATSIELKSWSERGYFMQQGVLYRYNPDVDSEEPQLVVPACLRLDIVRESHDSPIAGHHGIDRTFQRVAQRFFFPGMRRFITDYVKTCVTCQRYKASNEKTAGLLQTPVLNQRGEVLAIDIFGPLPIGENGERWIILVEDTATRWVELYALKEATSTACARVLIEEYFLRFGFPRRVISDNGVQFISAVMQQCMFILGIKQELLPLYHPQANPAERKNRDLKVQLAQLVDTQHNTWPEFLPSVRFAMNSALCQTTGVSPAYLTFARELRSPLSTQYDIRAVLNKDNFVPQITPYLKKFLDNLLSVRDRVEIQQDRRKDCADKNHKHEEFCVNDQVLLKSHVLSNASKNVSAKFVPKRDGPYLVVKKLSPTTYLISNLQSPDDVLGKFHVSELSRFHDRGDSPVDPVNPKRNRGRPRQGNQTKHSQGSEDHSDSGSQQVLERGRSQELVGEDVACTGALRNRRRIQKPIRFLNE